MNTASKLEDAVELKPSPNIEPITGKCMPLNLDGDREPLLQVILKVNEIIDWVNKR